jgi:hypothetical protein
MEPDVFQALPALVADGIVPPSAEPHLRRLASGDLVSLHRELRVLLYAGVLCFTSGIGVLIKENLDRLGPLTIIGGLALLALGALAWVARVAPPFSWQQVPSPNLAFDYVLLLAILLVSADLGFIEHIFDPVGRHVGLPFLVMSGLTALAALRFDSRVAFSFSLSSFAAWRGVTLASAGEAAFSGQTTFRLNILVCGVIFVILGFVLLRTNRKAHFEPVASYLGWLLILGGLASGLASLGWSTALLLVGTGLAVGAFLGRRFALFAYGLLAAYAALIRLGGEVVSSSIGCLLVSASAGGVVIVLLMAYRYLRKKAA